MKMREIIALILRQEHWQDAMKIKMVWLFRFKSGTGKETGVLRSAFGNFVPEFNANV